MEFPTISYDEALEKELQYKRKLNMNHLQGSYHTALVHKFEEPAPFQSITPISQTQTQTQTQTRNQIQINSNFRTQNTQCNSSITQRQQPSSSRHRPMKRRQVSPRHMLTPIQPRSYWCKLCKIDCTTEYNFRAHIGGKRHEANKLAILRGHNRTARTGESSVNQSRRNQNLNADGNESIESSRESEGVIDLTNDE